MAKSGYKGIYPVTKKSRSGKNIKIMRYYGRFVHKGERIECPSAYTAREAAKLRDIKILELKSPEPLQILKRI